MISLSKIIVSIWVVSPVFLWVAWRNKVIEKRLLIEAIEWSLINQLFIVDAKGVNVWSKREDSGVEFNASDRSGREFRCRIVYVNSFWPFVKDKKVLEKVLTGKWVEENGVAH